jgi:apolipoprotein N-acyltransferase
VLKQKNLLLSLLSGLLLWAAWPVSPLTPLIFIAWIPLLIVADTQFRKRRFFLHVYLTMFIWNVATTWWIWYATKPGAIGAFLVNSFIMCLPWLAYRSAKRRLGHTKAFIALIAFWMAFEYIHLHDWGLSWPWLTLGNVFATHPDWVQWYEFTGSSGGTLWVLVVNVLLFQLLKNSKFQIPNSKFTNGASNLDANSFSTKKIYISISAIIILPLVVSYTLLKQQPASTETGSHNVVVVQPNIDPYEKISTGSFDAQLQKLLSTSQSVVDSNTVLLIWPETALYSPYGFEENRLRDNYFLNPLWSFLKQHPRLQLFTGIESFRSFTAADKTSDAKQFKGSDLYYESYNGSVLLDSSGALQVYHKSMLVPGAETLPWFLKFLSKWFDKFGGTTGGYTKQNDRTVINSAAYKLAPAICYESIYGEFMSRYMKNGANLICIITNDGWWRKTPGHKQHMSYARLRAIETRRWVARSANTGISCFISPAGEVLQPQPYNTRAAIKMNIPVTEGQTLFVRIGDWLSKLALAVAAGFIIWLALLKWGRKSK